MESDQINCLPENLLLNIFSYLTVKERCRASRVCQAWRRISDDNDLWRRVDLTSYDIDVIHLKQIIRKRLSPALVSLALRGFEHAAVISKKQNITNALLVQLTETCPNIKHLRLQHVNLTDVSLSAFPSSLDSLALRDSMVPMGWFTHGLGNTNDVVPRLRHLDMSGSKICDADLKACVGAWSGMVSLRLNECYRITKASFEAIVDQLTDLVVLEVRGTKFDNGILHRYCRSVNKLEKLDLSGCTNIRTDSVAYLRLMPNLKVVMLKGCQLGPSVTLADFRDIANLRHLDLQLTSLSPDQTLSVLPLCRVVL